MNKYIGPEKCRVQGCHSTTGLVDGWCVAHRAGLINRGGYSPRGDKGYTPNPPLSAGQSKTGGASGSEIVAKNDSNKVIIHTQAEMEAAIEAETGGSRVVIPFASLKVAEDMFGDNRKVSKKFINKVHFNYQRVLDLPNVRLTPQQQQLLRQTSPTILIKAS
jgi:hypothetical protein